MHNEPKRIADMSQEEFLEHFPSHTASAVELAWEAGFIVAEAAFLVGSAAWIAKIGYTAIKDIHGKA